jgi:hypothetical protein
MLIILLKIRIWIEIFSESLFLIQFLNQIQILILYLIKIKYWT